MTNIILFLLICIDIRINTLILHSYITGKPMPSKRIANKEDLFFVLIGYIWIGIILYLFHK